MLTDNTPVARPPAAPPRRGVLVRYQRHQRPHHHRASPASVPGAADARGTSRLTARWLAGRVGRWLVCRWCGRVGAVPERLREQAGRLAELVGGRWPERSWLTSGFRLVTTRSLFAHRAVVLVGDRRSCWGGCGTCGAWSADGAVGGVEAAGGRGGRSVFVFPGQGSQWVGMAVALLECSPVFAEAVAWSVGRRSWQRLWIGRWGSAVAGCAGGTAVGVGWMWLQPVLFAVMVSLAELWRCVGVVPDAVVGHSRARSRRRVWRGCCRWRTRRGWWRCGVGRAGAWRVAGGWCRCGVAAAVVERLIARWGEELSVAAVNGPGSVVVSGDMACVTEFLELCDERGAGAAVAGIDWICARIVAQVEGGAGGGWGR